MTFAMRSPFFKHHNMLSLPRLLTPPWPRHKMLRLPRKCKMHEQKVLRLPRENDTLIFTRLESIAPATSFHTFETKNRRFYASFSYTAIFTKLQKYDFLRGFRNFSRQSPNGAPATTFDTVSCLRSPDTAIHGKSTLDTSQNAAPATQMQNAALQSAAPATRKRHACVGTRPKYCACSAKRENDLPSCDFEAAKRAFRARLPSNFTCRGNLPEHLRKLSRMAVN